MNDIIAEYVDELNELKYESRYQFGTEVEGDKEKIYQKTLEILTEDRSETPNVSSIRKPPPRRLSPPRLNPGRCNEIGCWQEP